MTGRHRRNLPPAAPPWGWGVVVAVVVVVFVVLVFGP